ncbi:hypothetical protein [Candidatus Albibeggiatoa sp. nov. BB20]|uniref:hypothetical protein n=1 Tax=Candidatus Albibeggiatoa sp. nov. BB20 TaxID=3162723 RepID=UPI00336562C3
MKSILYSILLIGFVLGLSACNKEEAEPNVSQPATPEKLEVIQKAEQVEDILKEKAEADKHVIDDATQ